MKNTVRADSLPAGTRVAHPRTGEPIIILAVEHPDGMPLVGYDRGDCCTAAHDRLGAAGRLHAHWMHGDTQVQVIGPKGSMNRTTLVELIDVDGGRIEITDDGGHSCGLHLRVPGGGDAYLSPLIVLKLAKELITALAVVFELCEDAVGGDEQ